MKKGLGVTMSFFPSLAAEKLKTEELCTLTREYKNIEASGEKKYLKQIFTESLLTTSLITVFP
jgi:hypothetical protein